MLPVYRICATKCTIARQALVFHMARMDPPGGINIIELLKEAQMPKEERPDHEQRTSHSLSSSVLEPYPMWGTQTDYGQSEDNYEEMDQEGDTDTSTDANQIMTVGQFLRRSPDPEYLDELAKAKKEFEQLRRKIRKDVLKEQKMAEERKQKEKEEIKEKMRLMRQERMKRRSGEESSTQNSQHDEDDDIQICYSKAGEKRVFEDISTSSTGEEIPRLPRLKPGRISVLTDTSSPTVPLPSQPQSQWPFQSDSAVSSAEPEPEQGPIVSTMRSELLWKCVQEQVKYDKLISFALNGINHGDICKEDFAMVFPRNIIFVKDEKEPKIVEEGNIRLEWSTVRVATVTFVDDSPAENPPVPASTPQNVQSDTQLFRENSKEVSNSVANSSPSSSTQRQPPLPVQKQAPHVPVHPAIISLPLSFSGNGPSSSMSSIRTATSPPVKKSIPDIRVGHSSTARKSLPVSLPSGTSYSFNSSINCSGGPDTPSTVVNKSISSKPVNQLASSSEYIPVPIDVDGLTTHVRKDSDEQTMRDDTVDEEPAIETGWMNPHRGRRPHFIPKLWDLLNEESCADSIFWDDSGLSFYITDTQSLCNNVLPQLLRSQNFTTFQSYLVQHGFTRMQKGSKVFSQNQSLKDCWRYGHEFFQRNHPELVEKVTRNAPKSVRSKRRSKKSTPVRCAREPELESVLKRILNGKT